MKYRAEIDGLRALAVLPVILFHAGFEWFTGGYVGVDVFFVISGYLITTILIEDIENKRFSILNFYERRARRILPALFLVVISTYIISWQFLNPFDLKEVAQSIFATSIFSSNIYFYLKTGYFDTSAELKPLLHTWSLAVEEQYYLLFPIFLILTWRFGKNRVFWMIIMMAIISLLLSEWGWRNNPSANFYLAPTRVWELLAGSIAAFIVHKHGVQKNNPLALLGISAIIFSIFFYNENTPFPSFYALVPVLGAVLLVLYANKGTIVAKFLSKKVFVGIGLISYSLYLWHQPIFALTRQYFVNDFSQLFALMLILVIFFLSYLTWKFIEQPARKFKNSTSDRIHVLLISALIIVVMSTIGMLGHIERGYPDRNENLLRLAQNGGISFICSGAEIEDRRCMTAENPQIALWGDSHAMHLAKALDQAFPLTGIHQLTLSACPPVPGYTKAPIKTSTTCEDFNSKVYSYLNDNPNSNIKTLIVASSYSFNEEDVIDNFIFSMGQLQNQGIRIILVSSTPRFPKAEQCITLAMRGSHKIENCSFLINEATNFESFMNLEDIAKSLNIELVSLIDFMCREGKCDMVKNDKLILRDGEHFTNEVQSELAIYLKQMLEL